MSEGRDPKEETEDILNVIRRGDEEWLSTKEIADELTIKKRQVSGRLNDLEADNRVRRRVLGQTHVWGLAETELEDTVDPTLGDVVRRSKRLREAGEGAASWGRDLFYVGGLAALLSLSTSFQGLTLPVIPPLVILVFGYMCLAGGGAALFVGKSLHLAGVVAPRVSERIHLDEDDRSERPKDNIGRVLDAIGL